ncbi:MAG: WxcM-like domain-containing protein [Nitrosopumilus sp.]|jgi:oxalate decarboxylase/phosphoglucose isomerase-like protein (cupin superfamily)|nr:WxcM-like domain-containing protein [Nitrosopumilus sp.]
MHHPTVFNCSILSIPKIKNRAGNISPVHNSKEIPFEVQRIFYLYDVPGGESRGAHAHKNCHQFLIAASGSFEVLLDDGSIQRLVQLNRPNMGLHIPPYIWASEINFSSGSICLVLASQKYSADDYIRDYNIFKQMRNDYSSTG